MLKTWKGSLDVIAVVNNNLRHSTAQTAHLEVGGNPPHTPDPEPVPRVTTNWICRGLVRESGGKYTFRTITRTALCHAFTIGHYFRVLCSLLLPYWTSLFVLRRTCRQSGLCETLFHCNTLSKHHYHHHHHYYFRVYPI
jgi:hypothetical protein